MGRKKSDLRQIDAMAKAHGMSPEQHQDFCEYIEQCKRVGDRGTMNDRGDFIWDELDRKAEEFLGLSGGD